MEFKKLEEESIKRLSSDVKVSCVGELQCLIRDLPKAIKVDRSIVLEGDRLSLGGEQLNLFEAPQKLSLNEALSFIVKEIKSLDLDSQVDALNTIRYELHNVSPFKSEPVDLIKWVKVDSVTANDYNPNSVAPPEMELLRHSINNDGYTQPVVTWVNNKDTREVIDGFHRTRVCKELDDVRNRVHGYLPVVTANDTCTSRSERMASTVRHNRARGKHNVTAMSDMVIELKNRNWKNSRIAKELGMDEDEVLRLCQITGLEDLFKDGDFSKAWDAQDSTENEFEPLTDEFESEHEYRTTNTSDPTRIFHTYEKWECVGYNFYGTKADGLTKDEAEQKYADFLSDSNAFREGLEAVLSTFKHSCEHYLTNKAMNRIAWLGQASVAIIHKIPCKFCGGFNRLSEDQKETANELALEYLNMWLKDNGLDEVDMSEALSLGRQVSIY